MRDDLCGTTAPSHLLTYLSELRICIIVFPVLATGSIFTISARK